MEHKPDIIAVFYNFDIKFICIDPTRDSINQTTFRYYWQ